MQQNRNLQKIFALSGLVVLLLAIAATIFTFVMTSGPFIHDFMDISYYARYAFVILGGFSVGYLLSYFSTEKKKRTKTSLIFAGVSFGLLTFSLYLLLDMLRLPIRDIFGEFTYPYGKLIFAGLPVATLLIVAFIAFILFMKGVKIAATSRRFQLLFLIIFLLQQIAIFISVGFLSTDAEVSTMAIIIALVNIIATPLFISLIAYLALKVIGDTATRLFSAAAIGVIYQAATYMLWEFRTDPMYEATLIFSAVVTIATYIGAGVLIIASRHAALSARAKKTRKIK